MIGKLLKMVPGKVWLGTVLVACGLAMGAALLAQHDARVRAEAVAALLEEKVDSLRQEVDALWDAKAADDSAHQAQLDSLNAELEKAKEEVDSLVIELPPLQQDTDSLIAVLEEFAPEPLQPVVRELRLAVNSERQTTASIILGQQRQIATLNALWLETDAKYWEAMNGWEAERKLRLTLEEQLAAVINANKPDLLMDRVVPFALGAGAVLLVDKVF